MPRKCSVLACCVLGAALVALVALPVLPASQKRGVRAAPGAPTPRLHARAAALAGAPRLPALRRLGLRGGRPGGGNVTDADVVRVLAHMLVPDSAQIRAAEEDMDAMVGAHAGACARGLLACMLCEGTAMELRQLAAVVLRRRIGDMWPSLSAPQQEDVQERLGDALAADLGGGSAKLRRLLALCVAATAALSSSPMQQDAVVGRILAAATGAQGPPNSVAVAIETLELLMESMAHDMMRHFDAIHGVTMAALQHAHPDVLHSGVKLASSLLMQSFGLADAGWTAELLQSLHAVLARAVAGSDADTADCIFVALTDVVPFSWGTEASSRTPQMIELALNVTARETMPLPVREHASLFVVELAQCQSHVLREHRLFVSITRRLTLMAHRALLDHAAHAHGADQFLHLFQSENTPLSDQGLGRHVLEKRQDVLMRDDDVHAPEVMPADAAVADSSEMETEKPCDILVRALRLVLQSEGAKEAIPAFVQRLDVLSSPSTWQHRMAELLLLRTCCEASLSSSLQGLQPRDTVRPTSKFPAFPAR